MSSFTGRSGAGRAEITRSGATARATPSCYQFYRVVAVDAALREDSCVASSDYSRVATPFESAAFACADRNSRT